MCVIVCVSLCCLSCVCSSVCLCVLVFVSLRVIVCVVPLVSLCGSHWVKSRALDSINLSHIGSKPCRNAVKKYALLKYLHIYLHLYLHLYLLFRFLTITQFWPKNKNFNISFLIFPSRF